MKLCQSLTGGTYNKKLLFWQESLLDGFYKKYDITPLTYDAVVELFSEEFVNSQFGPVGLIDFLQFPREYFLILEGEVPDEWIQKAWDNDFFKIVLIENYIFGNQQFIIPILDQLKDNQLNHFKLLIRNIFEKEENQIDNEDLIHSLFNDFSRLKKYLTDHPDKINEQTSHGYTVLHRACLIGNDEIVNYLVDQGIDTELRAKDGKTALFACSPELVRILNIADVNINACDNSGHSLLQVAYMWNDFELINLLLSIGIDTSLKNSEGQCFLDGSFSRELLDLVLSHKDCITYRASNGSSILFEVFRKESVVKLIDFGIDINLLDENGNSALMHQITQRRFEVVDKLIENNADINLYNYSGSALHRACIAKNIELVKKFISMDVNLSCIDGEGNTALHIAARYSDPEIIQILLDTGMDKDLKNNEGKKALDLAENSNNRAPFGERDKKQSNFPKTEKQCFEILLSIIRRNSTCSCQACETCNEKNNWTIFKEKVVVKRGFMKKKAIITGYTLNYASRTYDLRECQAFHSTESGNEVTSYSDENVAVKLVLPNQSFIVIKDFKKIAYSFISFVEWLQKQH